MMQYLIISEPHSFITMGITFYRDLYKYLDLQVASNWWNHMDDLNFVQYLIEFKEAERYLIYDASFPTIYYILML